MREVYILYNKNTGVIEGSGRVDRIREALKIDFNNLDSSTLTSFINIKKAENEELDVLYKPNYDWFPLLPDSEQYKVIGGAVILLSEQELQDIETKNQQKILVDIKIREIAKQSLIDEGKLPIDYKE